jgi:hypothetical protein
MEKDNKFKITKAELQQIIKEEYAAMAKDNARAEEIKARLAQINEELETLPETLSEVEATGTKKVSATGWTGDGEGDVKYGEKFEKIGTHLKEDEELEGELEVGGEEMEGDEAGYFEMKFAELGKELDEKMAGSEEMEDEVEVEVGDDMGDEAEAEEVEVEEMDESVKEGEDCMDEEVEVEEEMMNEDLEEPIEGETPAQDSEARFNDYMEKDKHVNEGVKGGTSLLSEGFTAERKTALDSELERMKALAKINR